VDTLVELAAGTSALRTHRGLSALSVKLPTAATNVSATDKIHYSGTVRLQLSPSLSSAPASSPPCLAGGAAEEGGGAAAEVQQRKRRRVV
jgi:hypothetical protein